MDISISLYEPVPKTKYIPWIICMKKQLRPSWIKMLIINSALHPLMLVFTNNNDHWHCVLERSERSHFLCISLRQLRFDITDNLLNENLRDPASFIHNNTLFKYKRIFIRKHTEIMGSFKQCLSSWAHKPIEKASGTCALRKRLKNIYLLLSITQLDFFTKLLIYNI